MKQKLLQEIPGGLIILLFTYASFSKIMAFPHFIHEINNQPLPQSWKTVLPYAVPVFELAAVLLLSIPAWRLAGFILSAFLMLSFTAYVSVVLLHGFSYIPCSCGGVIEGLSWKQHLILNIAYFMLCLLGIRLSLHHRVLRKKT